MEEPQSTGPEVTSPTVRSSSPSPSIPATPAISSYSSPDRTFSSGSSHSVSSATSADARSTVSTSSRRHGYTRALGAEFAESARHRDSVMSLGSIAHLQYYFARTGLLDGKTGRGKEAKKKNGENVPRLLITPNEGHIDDFVASPSDMNESPEFDPNDDEEVMLPPTVSTYSIKTHHIPPPPSLITLRRDLQVALEKADSNIQAIEEGAEPRTRESFRASLSPGDVPDTEDDPARQIPTPQTKEEAQGMCILDDVTMAIRAAKIYYTTHPYPDRLASLKSEREIRKDLFHVLDVLKRWAARHFACGLRPEERDVIQGWISGVRTMLVREKALEDLEAQERENWDWAQGDWTGRERSREESFLRSLMPEGHTLPEWTPIEDDATIESLPTPFLEHFRDGRILVQLHNIAVKKSNRQFGEIKTYHEDIAKPYRQADNLRFWIKAAELRWELRFQVDVMGVVQATSDAAWRQFDNALLAWCRTVREELIRDWQAANPGRPPSAGLI
ncbi:hypothetical protein N7466_007808 [Penicillium verhagenii]|uniref:uncharacterized protein n=1 Tax=Penicillium verhagenii TaxID=1562060 RepID=UPI0025453BAE|nr:uncharacterized protein N7466_007808 [Penicillium verhagenii]KAJ5928852.1 hypothetical protein N7466_007808 [Penicillium verhagenii]